MRTLLLILLVINFIKPLDYDEISYIDYLDNFVKEDNTQDKLKIILNCEFEDIKEFYDL